MSTKTVSSRISEESYSKLIETANRQGKPISVFLKELIENAVNTSKQNEQNDEMMEIEIVDDDKKESEIRINEEPEVFEVEPPEEDLIEMEEEKDTYVCPKCEYEDNKPFNFCPRCGVKLEWE